MKALIALIKIESMSSLEIAGLTNKRHSHVLRDIRQMELELKARPDQDGLDYKGINSFYRKNGQIEIVHLDKVHTLTLVAGYSYELRINVINRWQFLEEQLEIVKARTGSKKHQLSAMEALHDFLPDDLHDFLPDDLQDEAVSYIKANTVVNKATSNLFGFPKMLKKDDMSQDMLVMREKILDDYLALFGVLEDNSKVKELLYGKYQPKRIESQVVELKLVNSI
jgi:phage regulator Rha-like protein